MCPRATQQSKCSFLFPNMQTHFQLQLSQYSLVPMSAGVSWQEGEQGNLPTGTESKGRLLLDTLLSKGFTMHAPHAHQLHQPTSRPRQDGITGKIIDWLASKCLVPNRTTVVTDSCFLTGTDHDFLHTRVTFKGALKQRVHRIRTGKRRLTTDFVPASTIDQDVLETLAKAHTAHPQGKGYRDDAVTRTLFRTARQSRSAHAWKRAFQQRKQCRDEWKAQRIRNAVRGDRQAVREIQPQKYLGWESRFAQNMAPRDPHQVLHDHFANTFSCPGFTLSRSTCPPPSPDITVEELEWALRSGKRGRSVGTDGVSLELIQKVADNPQGKGGLVSWFNHILHSGELPQKWHDVLLILLPKCTDPNQAKQVRGIARGCAAEKLFCRIILERSKTLFALSHEHSVLRSTSPNSGSYIQSSSHHGGRPGMGGGHLCPEARSSSCLRQCQQGSTTRTPIPTPRG